MRQHRLWIPLSVLVLSIVGLVWMSFLPELDTNVYRFGLMVVPMTFGGLTLLWFLLLGRFSGRARLIGLGAAVVLFGGWKALVKVDGAVSGTGIPRYVWRWTSGPERKFAQQVIAAAPTVADTAEVPQFLGKDRNGILADPGLDTDWKAHAPKELWRISAGEGWGAFCVVGGRAITQEQRGAEEWVTCYDLATGKELWHHADQARFSEWQGGDGPRGTPTHEAGKLYVIGGTGILNCLDLATGKALWTHDTLKEHNQPNLKWAVSGSPLIIDNQVIVTGGDKPGPTLVSYDKATGKELWKAGDVSASYASPMLATIAGKRVIIDNAAPGLMLHDAATGEVLLFQKWGFEGPPKASQPILLPGDRLFISAGYMMGCTMFQITNEGGKFAAKELWSNSKMKTQFNSVTPIGDLLFGLDDGKMACMDSKTGDRLWKDGKFGAGQHLIVGNYALIQSEPGPVILAEVKREGFKELSSLQALSTKTWNYPTLAGRHLLVRNDREAACYELPMK